MPDESSLPSYPAGASPEATDRFRWLFEHLPVGVLVAESSGRIVRANRAFCNFVDYSGSELVGRSFADLVHTDDQKKLNDALAQLDGQALPSLDCENRYLRKDGSETWGRTQLAPLPGSSSGKGTECIATVTDINRLKAADEARAHLFEETNDLIQSIAADGSILYANRSWRETLGYTREELPMLNVFQIIHDDCREHCMAAFGQLMQGENVGLIQVSFTAKDGRTIELEGNVSARMENGVMVSSRGIFRDITARKRAEDELRATFDRLERQNASLAALARDPALRGPDTAPAFRKITEAAAQVLDISRASIWFYDHARGFLRCDDLHESPENKHSQGLELRMTDYPAYFEALAEGRVLAAHDARTDARTRGFDPGYLKPLGITSMLDAPVRTDRGVVGVICCEHIGTARRWTQDEQTFTASLADLIALSLEISERHQAEAALDDSVQKLKRSNTELEQFAYVASHDLQEPLRAISGCVQILKRNFKQDLDVRAEELIEHTIQGVTRMQTLINDLLTYSRVIRQPAALVPVDLGDVLAEAMRNLEAAIDQSGAIITHDALPTVPSETTQCIQLFQNLLGNSIKFRGPEPPQIHVSAKRQQNMWELSVRDTGIGIDKQYFDRIFTLFQRLHTRSEYEGTGIGLSICQKIVEGHGGQIRVESAPGEGATFFFTMPCS